MTKRDGGKFQRAPDLVRSCGTILILFLFGAFMVGLLLAFLRRLG